jgi:predicted DsbA family dithiol-disulfide isomerase
MLLEIEIVSDVICPWCFIGKRQLEKALHTFNNRHEITVMWRPFQLNPTMPLTGMDRQAYRSAKFGGAAAARDRDMRVAKIGAEAGIIFNFENVKRTPNTLDAHRLIWLAAREKLQDAVVEALFQSYFINGEDIGDRQILTRIAKATGLDERSTQAWLNSDDGVEAVRAEAAHALQRGIQSVPGFIVNDKTLGLGVPDVSALIEAIAQATQSLPNSD